MDVTPVMAPPAAPGLQIDWGDALAVPIFYGRQEEQALLSRRLVQEHCRVVSVLGMGGIGKSALSVHIMHQMTEHFETIIFRSSRGAPSCETLVSDCLQALSPQPLSALPSALEQRIGLLLERLEKLYHLGKPLVMQDNASYLLVDPLLQAALTK